MAHPPSAGSDIGPIPDANARGGPPSRQGTDAPSKREVRPDTAEPVLEPSEEPAAKPAETAQPSVGQPPSPQGDQKPIMAPATAEEPWPEIDYSKGYEEAEKASIARMKGRYGEALVDDVEDAQLLLSYISRNGLQEATKVEDKTIETLIRARHRVRKGKFGCEEEEANFRKHYGIIARAAEPVTVASLRDSVRKGPCRRWFSFGESKKRPNERPIAEIACLRYRNYAMWTLVALLASQIYWTISSSVLSKTEALIAEMNKAPTKEYYLEQEAARLAALKPASQSTGAGPAATTVVSPEATSSASKGDQPLTLDELVSKIGELNANYSMLCKLMAPVMYVSGLRPPDPTADKDKSNPANETPVKTPTPTPATPTPAADIFTPSHFQNESASIRTVAAQVIDVMQKWLLPLLYGALGALVFVVRTLSMQARDRLFRQEAVVSLILRVFLGMISGLAIGWFWNHNLQTPGTAAEPLSVTTLSPFALAFVAGYGVEIFFTLLDKIISTFTNKP